MRAISIRGSRGEVSVEAVSATDLKTRFGEMFDRAQRDGLVAISKHDVPRAVLVSMDEYNRLLAQIPDPLSALSAEFDQMYAQMQTAGHRTAMDAAFSATPAQMGGAALAAAKRAKRAKRQTARKHA
jgi:antitoxin Phd